MPAEQLAFTHVVWDKLLHLVEYALLGFLAARALIEIKFGPRLTIWAVSVAFCYLYGLSDEFHQSFTPGRESALSDACADFLGGGLGAGTNLLVQQWFNKREVVSHVSA